MNKLLKRPLRSEDEAAALAGWIAGQRAKLEERGRIALVVATLLAVFGAIISLSSSDTGSSDGLILPAMAILAAAVASPYAVRRWWAHPRVLETQRRLLRDRGLVTDDFEAPEATLTELEERISQAESLLDS